MTHELNPQYSACFSKTRCLYMSSTGLRQHHQRQATNERICAVFCGKITTKKLQFPGKNAENTDKTSIATQCICAGRRTAKGKGRVKSEFPRFSKASFHALGRKVFSGKRGSQNSAKEIQRCPWEGGCMTQPVVIHSHAFLSHKQSISLFTS